MAAKKGLYANINAKRERIAKGSGEKMRELGEKGAPSKQNFQESAKTAKKPSRKAKSKSSQSWPSKKSGAKTKTSSR